jgi:hypothetical protein
MKGLFTIVLLAYASLSSAATCTIYSSDDQGTQIFNETIELGFNDRQMKDAGIFEIRASSAGDRMLSAAIILKGTKTAAVGYPSRPQGSKYINVVLKTERGEASVSCEGKDI